MAYPAKYRYTREHEWIRLDDAGGNATVGITDHAQHALGDIVYIELPKVGDRFDAMQPLGSVESVKAVSEIFSPAAGEITEVNGTLTAEPELLNKYPHDEAWLVKMRLSAAGEVEKLLTAEQYEKYLAEENV